MSIIDSYIKIDITRESAALDPISLDTMLFIGDSNNEILASAATADQRVKEYGSLLEVATDYPGIVNNGATTYPPEYLAAQLYFGQAQRPTRLLIGQVFTKTAAVPEVPGVPAVPAVSETFAEAFLAIQLINNNFYGVAISSKEEDDVLAIAAAVEANGYGIFGTSTNDVNVANSANDETNILWQLQDLAYSRTFGIYNSKAGNTYPECANFGLMLTEDVGSSTWAWKTLVGVSPDNYTTQNQNNIQRNSANFFTRIAGRSAFLDGVMANKEHIDLIIGVDWVRTRMQLSIADALFKTGKIPFTNAGIGVVENLVRNNLKVAADKGILVEDTIKVTVPDVRNVSASSKANRTLTGVKFEAESARAIQKVGILGTITI